MAVILEFPRPDIDDNVDAEIVSILASYLQRAKDGEVRSLVVLATGADGHPECAMQMDRGDAVSLVGTLKAAEHRISAALDVIID